jgi:hypothetical protein
VTFARKVLRLAIAGVVIVSVLYGCMGWMPGRQSYWDAKVKEMCKTDGGVTIYEKIRISRADLKRGVLPVNADGKIEVSVKGLARPDAPVYAEPKITYIRKSNPQVARVEVVYIRRSDNAVVARTISYGRFGGDIPSPSHPSSFACPDSLKLQSEMQELFVVDGAAN